MSTKQDKPIYIRLDQETHDWLRQEAAQQGRTMSNLARLYVQRGLRDGVRYVTAMPVAHGQSEPLPA